MLIMRLPALQVNPDGIKAGQRQRIFAAAEMAIDADKSADARLTYSNFLHLLQLKKFD